MRVPGRAGPGWARPSSGREGAAEEVLVEVELRRGVVSGAAQLGLGAAAQQVPGLQ